MALGVARHFLQRLIAFVGGDLHHLDLVELVLADHARVSRPALPASERKHGVWR